MSTSTTESGALREENRTLYAVINLVSSSIELGPMLHGVVDLATHATDCHACFIYLLEDDRLTIRAASHVFADAVGGVELGLDEGLTGWVARNQTPAFIRERAMDDERMKYIPLLQEERFQSMVAVPILSRSGETLGVVVLHTEAPREFNEDTVKLLEHIASLVSGAIENAQLYQRERSRVDTLTQLASLGGQVASATDAAALAAVVARGMRRMLGAKFCQIYRFDSDAGSLELLRSDPEQVSGLPPRSAADLLMEALDGRGYKHDAHREWPGIAIGDLLVTPLTAGGERVGLICVGSPPASSFSSEDTELARAIAQIAAVAIKRAELIEHLTNSSIVKDLFEALAAGATAFAVAKAAEVRCDLTQPFLIICAEPVRGLEPGSVEWLEAAGAFGRRLCALEPRAAVEAGPGPVRAAIPLRASRRELADELLVKLRELGVQSRAVIGMSQVCAIAADASRAYREALDAATIGRALLDDGGALAYQELGAYRYLVQIDPEEAPSDRMRAAVDVLIDYDARRGSSLLDTLERYLTERRSVIDSARVLFIHPNTLRQRLARIEELTRVKLDQADLLSLELAIKLARLHGRQRAERSRYQGTGAPSASQPPRRRHGTPPAS